MLLLSHNDLVAFDATIPVTLTDIYIDHNSLTAPPSFSITSNIDILHMQYNTFQIPVDYFESFTNLRELSIEKMGLTRLPDVRKNTRSVTSYCYPDPMPVSVYTGDTLQCTLCIHCSGASVAPV